MSLHRIIPINKYTLVCVGGFLTLYEVYFEKSNSKYKGGRISLVYDTSIVERFRYQICTLLHYNFSSIYFVPLKIYGALHILEFTI